MKCETCEKRAIRSSKFEVRGSEFRKARTSDLEPSPFSPVPPVSLGCPCAFSNRFPPHSLWSTEHRSLHHFHICRQLQIEECIAETYVGLERRKFKTRDIAAGFVERDRPNEVGLGKHF